MITYRTEHGPYSWAVLENTGRTYEFGPYLMITDCDHGLCQLGLCTAVSMSTGRN